MWGCRQEEVVSPPLLAAPQATRLLLSQGVLSWLQPDGRKKSAQGRGRAEAWLEPPVGVGEGRVGTLGTLACPEQPRWCQGNRQHWEKRNQECLLDILMVGFMGKW